MCRMHDYKSARYAVCVVMPVVTQQTVRGSAVELLIVRELHI